jgi:hypothetical protein
VIPKLWVGRVWFYEKPDDPAKLVCVECEKAFAPEKCATHARKRHKKLYDGVLPGQLGMPGTGTPDVPQDVPGKVLEFKPVRKRARPQHC